MNTVEVNLYIVREVLYFIFDHFAVFWGALPDFIPQIQPLFR